MPLCKHRVCGSVENVKKENYSVYEIVRKPDELMEKNFISIVLECLFECLWSIFFLSFFSLNSLSQNDL